MFSSKLPSNIAHNLTRLTITNVCKNIITNHLRLINPHRKQKILEDEYLSVVKFSDNYNVVNTHDLEKKYKIKGLDLLQSFYRNALKPGDLSDFYHQITQKYNYLLLCAKQETVHIDTLTKNDGTEKVGIYNTFHLNSNLTHEFEVEGYAKEHGLEKFHTALIELINNKLELRGLDSILYDETLHVIESIAKNINQENYKQLYYEFINNSIHTNADTMIDITVLMNKYNIEGYELFYEMVKTSEPFNFGALDHDHKHAQQFTINDAKSIFVDYIEQHKEDDDNVYKPNTIFIDYYNGIAVKNYFRLDNKIKQTINIKKYDDRNSYGKFYQCILRILNRKINKQKI